MVPDPEVSHPEIACIYNSSCLDNRTVSTTAFSLYKTISFKILLYYECMKYTLNDTCIIYIVMCHVFTHRLNCSFLVSELYGYCMIEIGM